MSEDPSVPLGTVDGAVPNEFPDRCTRCGTTAPPDDIGRCPNPKCKCIRKGARLAAKNGPIDKAKRDQLRARFLRDYRPSTTIDGIRVRELADIAERLEGLRKGSAEYQRLVQTMASLDEALRAARSIQQPPDFAALSSEQLIARLETLLAAAREAQRKPAPAERIVAEPEAASTVSESTLGGPRASNAGAPDPSPVPKTAASPTSECAYCNGPCVGEAHESYYTLHPEAAQARDDERRNNEFRMCFGLPVADSPPARPAPTHEQRQQAELRRQLGWDTGVMNETKGFRYRE